MHTSQLYNVQCNVGVSQWVSLTIHCKTKTKINSRLYGIFMCYPFYWFMQSSLFLPYAPTFTTAYTFLLVATRILFRFIFFVFLFFVHFIFIQYDLFSYADIIAKQRTWFWPIATTKSTISKRKTKIHFNDVQKKKCFKIITQLKLCSIMYDVWRINWSHAIYHGFRSAVGNTSQITIINVWSTASW